MVKIIFLISLSAEVLTTIALSVSIAAPKYRIWPPRRRNSWEQFIILVLFNISAVGVIILGMIDWGAGPIPPEIRVVGLVGWLSGNGLAIWAVSVLGLASTAGNEGVLAIRGPYRISRNPQYVGFMIGLIGWGLMTNSLLTLGAALTALVPLAIVPVVEEPWLRMRYGAAYDAYKKGVPRFIVQHK